VEEDIEEMRAEERAQQAEATISMMELICSPTLRSPLIIGVVMQLSQQLSGINAVSVLKFCALVGYTVKPLFIVFVRGLKKKQWIRENNRCGSHG
jgi:hypothetical protein